MSCRTRQSSELTINLLWKNVMVGLAAPWIQPTEARKVRFGGGQDAYASPLFPRPDHTHVMNSVVRHVAGNASTCIVSHHARPGREPEDRFEDFSADNHAAYAERHGYHYWHFEGRLSDTAFTHPKAGDLSDARGGGAHWQKFSAIAAVADQVNSDRLPICRWVMWLDSDAVFTNFSAKIGAVVKSASKFGDAPPDVIVSRETAGWPRNVLNSGVFLVKNSWAGRAFLEGVARLHNDVYKDAILQDQDALQKYAFHKNPALLSLEEHDVALLHLRPEVVAMPQRAFNSFYWIDLTGTQIADITADFDPHLANWQRCDFVAHLAGVKPPSMRLSAMRQMSETIDSCA